MNYEIRDIEDRCKYLLTSIEEGCRKASVTRSQIKRLKTSHEVRGDMHPSYNDEVKAVPFVKEESDSLDYDFLDEVTFYLTDYRNLEDDFTKDDLYSILPSRRHYKYKDILYRLIAESIRDLKDIEELLLEDDNASSSELEEYKRLIEVEKRKISLLQESFVIDDNFELEDKHNRILLVPTDAGNIRVLDELEHVPVEYYERFLELFQSIIDGTFKNVKCFTNNSVLTGIYEVKAFGARVVFTRISRDTYAVITAFIKKSDYDKAYAESLRSKVSDYKKNSDKISGLLDNEEFLRENDLSVKYLFDLLSLEEKNKVKGGSCEEK